jgi:hypothetical protein
LTGPGGCPYIGVVTKPPTSPPAHILGGQATARYFARKNAAVRGRVRALREAGLTFEEIARVLEISRQRAHAIYHREVA